jgi:hypothetical protein
MIASDPPPDDREQRQDGEIPTVRRVLPADQIFLDELRVSAGDADDAAEYFRSLRLADARLIDTLQFVSDGKKVPGSRLPANANSINLLKTYEVVRIFPNKAFEEYLLEQDQTLQPVPISFLYNQRDKYSVQGRSSAHSLAMLTILDGPGGKPRQPYAMAVGVHKYFSDRLADGSDPIPDFQSAFDLFERQLATGKPPQTALYTPGGFTNRLRSTCKKHPVISGLIGMGLAAISGYELHRPDTIVIDRYPPVIRPPDPVKEVAYQDAVIVHFNDPAQNPRNLFFRLCGTSEIAYDDRSDVVVSLETGKHQTFKDATLINVPVINAYKPLPEGILDLAEAMKELGINNRSLIDKLYQPRKPNEPALIAPWEVVDLLQPETKPSLKITPPKGWEEHNSSKNLFQQK